MKFLFFFFAAAYILMSFAELIFERPSTLGRTLLVIFFGPWIAAIELIRAGLEE